MNVRSVALLFVVAGSAQAQPLVYYGGPVVSRASVVMVNWGPNVNSTVKSQLPQFFTDALNSSYIDLLSEYGTVGRTGAGGAPGSNQTIARGTFAGAFTITPSITATTLAESQIQSELKSQITAGKLPQPGFDSANFANTVYVVLFPAGISIVDPSGSASCQAFCVYHGTLSNLTRPVPYVLVPDLGSGACQLGCGTGTTLQNTTELVSHFLAGAITDPDVELATALAPPLAWIDGAKGEVGDLCSGQPATVTLNTGTWTVEKLWSNLQQACAVSVVDGGVCGAAGALRPPGCRSCTAADNDAGCSGATGVCETDAGDPKAGQCVGCTLDSQCPADERCEKSDAGTDDTCGCTSSSCGGTRPVCATSGPLARRCVGCVSDSDCGHTACQTVHCNTAAGTCDPPDAGPDGVACDDGSACTSNDSCSAGSCAGTPVTCPDAGACKSAACTPSTGACAVSDVADGTPCAAGMCSAGVCMAGGAGGGTAMGTGGGTGTGGAGTGGAGTGGSSSSGGGAGAGGGAGTGGAGTGGAQAAGGGSGDTPKACGCDAVGGVWAALAALLLARRRRSQLH